MKLTKYEHACVALEEQGKKLIIDPGEYTRDFGDIRDIVAVVVTHMHADHFFPENLQKIIAANPNVKIFTTKEATEQWSDPHIQIVQAGDEQPTAPFTLNFYGGLHKLVHPDWPQKQNIGVMVNSGKFYYAGDSLVTPNRTVEAVAVPVSNSWLSMGEAIEYMKAVKAKISIRTHDTPLSERGKKTADDILKTAAQKYNLSYRALNPGESIEI
jgi:L-ascorbate metabolism protein UlaG (beta-lactamase superfamily)